MLAKRMFFIGIVLALIVIVENFAIRGLYGLFIITRLPTGYIVIFSVLIGITIGYGIKAYLLSDGDDFNDDY